MSAPQHTDAARQAAIDDYYSGTDTIAAVAKRHGIPRSTVSGWIDNNCDDLAYITAEFDPSAWEVRGGVLRPLYPERRSA